MRVVVDTSGWYAGTVAEDTRHEEAKSFLSLPHELIIPFAVFVETIALLQSRQGKALAVRSGEVMNVYGIYNVSAVEEKKAWELYQKASAGISYVDSVVVTIAKMNDLPVFCFDKHFSSLGVQVFP